MKKQICLLVSILFVIGLAACSDEQRNFTMHEAGQYKGGTDPLLAKNMDQVLSDRFMQVQTDR